MNNLRTRRNYFSHIDLVFSSISKRLDSFLRPFSVANPFLNAFQNIYFQTNNHIKDMFAPSEGSAAILYIWGQKCEYNLNGLVSAKN